jgi:hypothetical protein
MVLIGWRFEWLVLREFLKFQSRVLVALSGGFGKPFASQADVFWNAAAVA